MATGRDVSTAVPHGNSTVACGTCRATLRAMSVMPHIPASTPCIGVCRLDRDNLCMGCRRSLGEIAGWSRMSEAERLRLMREVLPLRRIEARRA